MALKLIAFDWDGTLADTAQVTYRAMRNIFDHYGVAPPTHEEFFANITSGGMLAFYHDRGIPKEATRRDLNVLWQTYFNDPVRRGTIPLRDGAKEVLIACRGCGTKACIVSGSAHSIITNTLADVGMSAFIDPRGRCRRQSH